MTDPTTTAPPSRQRRRRIGKIIMLAIAAALVAGSLSACSTYAPADMVILYYTSGTGENREFHECIEPGKSGDYPIDDEIFALPTSIRTWNIRPKDGDTNVPITSGTLPVAVDGADGGTQPGAEVKVYATADFYLNTDCSKGKNSPIVKFWESTGRRYGISADGENGFSEGNFRKLLLNTFVPAEETAIRQETRKYNADNLDANIDAVWTTMERNLAPGFQRSLRDKLGGAYFCGTGYAGGRETTWKEWEPVTDAAGTAVLDDNHQPTYEEVDKKGTCPPVRITITDVGFSDPDVAKARARVYTAEQNAKANRIDAQAQRDRAAILNRSANNPNYVELQRIDAQRAAADACRHAKDCTVVVDGRGNSLVPVR